MKQLLIFGIFLLCASIVLVQSAVVNAQTIVINDINLVEPSDGIVSGKDSILVKAVISNPGPDFNSPITIINSVNDRTYQTCEGRCGIIEGSPLQNGLRSGARGEIYWAGTATDRDFLRIGQNEVRFIVRSGDSVLSEKSIVFTLRENTLPRADIGIERAEPIIVNSQLSSFKVTLKNYGPAIIKNETLPVSICTKSSDKTQDFGCTGGFINLMDNCASSYFNTNCDPDGTMLPGEEELFVFDSKESADVLLRINKQLRNNTLYLTDFSFDEVNGFKQYEDVNERNDHLKSSFIISSSFDGPVASVPPQSIPSYPSLPQTSIPPSGPSYPSLPPDPTLPSTSPPLPPSVPSNPPSIPPSQLPPPPLPPPQLPQLVPSSPSQLVQSNLCNGCSSDNMCYPIGYRKNTLFCSDQSIFNPQLPEDSSCSNNFECSSNLCIDDSCVSSGLWQRFLSFFSRFIG